MEQHNINFEFWKMAYTMRNGISIDMLRQAVITTINPFGDISKDEFKEISNVDFEVKETKPVVPQQPIQENNPVNEPTSPTPQEQPIQPAAQ